MIAVHTLAVAEAARAPEIGRQLEAVRQQVRTGVAEWLGRAQAVGLLRPGRTREMAAEFQGLLMGDLLVRIMERVAERPTTAQAKRAAARATAAIIRIYSSS